MLRFDIAVMSFFYDRGRNYVATLGNYVCS